MSSPELAPENLPEWCTAEMPNAVAQLRDLVDQNSFTFNLDGVNRTQLQFADKLTALGLEVELHAQKDRGEILVATTRACRDSNQHLVLVGHADTVHSPDKAFNSFLRDGDKLCGPGTYDMKSGLVVISLALESLKQLGVLDRIPIRVVVNSAEESSTDETRAFMSRSAELARAALVFEFGRSGGIVTSRKAFASYALHVEGRSAHAGNSIQEGANAITRLAPFLLRLPMLTDLSRGLTCNVGLVSGGVSTGVVPDSAAAEFEVRAATTVEVEALEAEVRKWAGGSSEAAYDLPEDLLARTSVTLTRQKLIPALNETPESIALADAYRAAALRAGLVMSRLPRVGGLSDANNIGGSGLPVIDGLGPEGNGAHTDQEYALATSLQSRALTLIYFLLDQPEAKRMQA